MQAAGFIPEKFPFTTKNPELLEAINEIIARHKDSGESTIASLPEQTQGTSCTNN